MTTAATSKSSARAIADVNGGLILATVEIAVPPERVFHALTASDEVVKWWGSDDEYRTTSWEADVRVGGRWRAGGKGKDGAAFSVEGEFLVVEAPTRLVQTWKPEWDGGNVTKLTYELEATAKGTRLTVRHEGFGDRADSCRGHTVGWERVLGWLEAYASPKPTATPLKYFVLKLIAPRKTFPFDMTDEERAMMMAHAEYWAGHLRAGTSVLYGPVGDPSYPYGLGIIRVADESEVAGLQANDPAIRAGKGFRYEVAPMLRAITLA